MSRDYDHLFKLLIIGDSGKLSGRGCKFKITFFFLRVFQVNFESIFAYNNECDTAVLCYILDFRSVKF